MAGARVEDARALLAAGRYDGAAYIVGYAIEFKLKARIATSLLAARAFPETQAEFERLAKLKNHKLDELLQLSGRRGRIDTSHVYKGKWSFLTGQWRPESRYSKVGSASPQLAADLIEAVESLLKVL